MLQGLAAAYSKLRVYSQALLHQVAQLSMPAKYLITGFHADYVNGVSFAPSEHFPSSDFIILIKCLSQVIFGASTHPLGNIPRVPLNHQQMRIVIMNWE